MTVPVLWGDKSGAKSRELYSTFICSYRIEVAPSLTAYELRMTRFHSEVTLPKCFRGPSPKIYFHQLIENNIFQTSADVYTNS